MNVQNKEEEDDTMGEDIAAEEVARRLRLIRDGKYQTEESSASSIDSPTKAKKRKLEDHEDEDETLHFKRPT